MSADFSKLLAAIAQANVEHADRDGLTGVRRAVFLDRGQHAPGEVCPSAQDEPLGERAWCYTCERHHEPVEWGDGCNDGFHHDRADRERHHRVRHRTAAGALEIVRPVRDTSWWHRWKAERACRKQLGHCWHPEGMIDWWCCLCSGETEGMPEQRCVFCSEG